MTNCSIQNETSAVSEQFCAYHYVNNMNPIVASSVPLLCGASSYSMHLKTTHMQEQEPELKWTCYYGSAPFCHCFFLLVMANMDVGFCTNGLVFSCHTQYSFAFILDVHQEIDSGFHFQLVGHHDSV